MKPALQYYEIREVNGKGRSVFTRRRFLAGETVVIGRIVRVVPQRTRYSFQLEWNLHVDLDEPARLLNHSCDPNLGIKKNKFGGYNFSAIRAIEPGEELCWDYAMTEYESIAVSKCRCNNRCCRRTISGYKGLTESIKKKYKGYLAPYLLEDRKNIKRIPSQNDRQIDGGNNFRKEADLS